jgi:hypothetical protein
MIAEGTPFWALVTYVASTPFYFTGEIMNEKPTISSSVHEAIQFRSKEDADFGLFMLGHNTQLKPEQHQIG